jgi:hypothetical protein
MKEANLHSGRNFATKPDDIQQLGRAVMAVGRLQSQKIRSSGRDESEAITI